MGRKGYLGKAGESGKEEEEEESVEKEEEEENEGQRMKEIGKESEGRERNRQLTRKRIQGDT